MRRENISALFYAMIAEMDLVVKNLINIFFISRFLGSEGAAAYEVVMPCVMIASAFVVLGYNGVQAVCSKDYGAQEAFFLLKLAGFVTFTFCPLSIIENLRRRMAMKMICMDDDLFGRMRLKRRVKAIIPDAEIYSCKFPKAAMQRAAAVG